MNHPLCITWILSLASSLTIFIRFNFYFFPTSDGRFSIIVTSLENIIFCQNKISRLIFRFPNIRWANLKILNDNYSQNHQNTKLKLNLYEVGKFHVGNLIFICVEKFWSKLKKSRGKLSNFNLNFPASYDINHIPYLTFQYKTLQLLDFSTNFLFKFVPLINYPLLTIWQFQCSIFSNFQFNQNSSIWKLEFES